MTSYRSRLFLCAVPAVCALVAARAGAQTQPAGAQGQPAGAPPPSSVPASVSPAAPVAPAPESSPNPAAPSPPLAAPPETPPPPPLAQPLPPFPSHGPYDGPPLLFGLEKPKLGAYASLGVAYTRMLHRDGVVTDLEAAMLIDHRLSLGLAGYVFSRTPRGPAAYDGTAREFATAYGGLRLRYAAFADGFPLYASLGVLVGGGVLTLRDRHGSYRRGCNDGWDDCDDDADRRNAGYFVVQPDIAVHANVTRWLRFSVTGGYRAASSASDLGYGSTALSGVVAGGSIDIGWF